MESNTIIENILKAIKLVVPRKTDHIALHEPDFSGNEWSYVKECLDTGWVSSAGGFVDRFEKMLAEYTGLKYAVVVVNGTAALHICLKLAGVQPNDEVFVPALTFIATANAVSYCGAIPHFVDSEEKTLGLDPYKLADYLEEIADLSGDGCFNKQTGRRIKAVVPMHTFGHPVDLDPLVELCLKYKLELLEDAAESLGSMYKGRHTGNFGILSALSFNGNKIITTGGGGAVLTNDFTLARMAKHVTTTAKLPHKWAFVHDMVGYNYRMPNINAALGCAQMERLPEYIVKKRALTDQYCRAFKGVKGVKFFKETDFARSNYWLNALLLEKEYAHLRDPLLALTNENGIMTRPAWTLMFRQPMYDDCPKMDLSVAEGIEKRLINIPSSVFWGDAYV